MIHRCVCFLSVYTRQLAWDKDDIPHFHVLADAANLFICCQLYTLWTKPKWYWDGNKDWYALMVEWFSKTDRFSYMNEMKSEAHTQEQSTCFHSIGQQQILISGSSKRERKEEKKKKKKKRGKILNSLKTRFQLNVITEICLYLSHIWV